ncbi:DUF4174 domain-containing protein [Enterobacteriaceae bacterium RIT697]|nr:DUF4174 domain-containing protein [Enterobacteriaceae bacterium RIT697]
MLRISSFLNTQKQFIPNERYGVQLQFKRLFITCLLTLAAPLQAADNTIFQTLTTDTHNLDKYQWKYRPVVIFAPSKSDADYVHQMKILNESKSALTDRDIVVLSDTSPADNGRLRAKLEPIGFELVLIGKDGGVKLREKRPISAEVLLSTIDRMPMRKANLD